MAFIHCEVSEGPRPGFKSIGVESVEGFAEYFSIEDQFLVPAGQDWYLPIAVVGRDNGHKTLLVELPVEADSGAKRVWVHEEAVTTNPREVVA